jgi:glycosyltransferase involved in cell wall biosynthesis
VSKVVIVAGYGPSLVRFRGPLLRALVDGGHEVVAVSCEPEPPEGFAALGATYLAVPELQRAGTDPVRDLRTIAALVRLFRRLRPDVVLSYTVKPVIYGTLAARLTRVPRRWALVTGLGYLFLDDGTRKQRVVQAIARPMYAAAMRSATGVFLQNPDDVRDLQDVGVLPRSQRVVLVAGSGIDVDRFVPSPVPEGPPVFLFVGRLLRDKGVVELVQAARLLQQRGVACRVQLLGPLDPNPACVSAEEVAGWRREGVVEVLGETRDVRPYLAACTVFVLPSYREGTPRSSLEAMAVGRAVITTDVPGCRETVTHGDNGLLVTVKDPVSLADAMARLAGDRAEVVRMGARGRALAETKFDVRKVVAAMAAALDLTAGRAT